MTTSTLVQTEGEKLLKFSFKAAKVSAQSQTCALNTKKREKKPLRTGMWTKNVGQLSDNSRQQIQSRNQVY